MWHWLITNQPGVTAITGAVTALSFVISVCIALYQINKARQTQMETTARNIFNDYLKKAFEYPIFSYPPTHLDQFDFTERTFSGSLVEFERYEWFVSILIVAMREILDFLSHDKYWEMTARTQLSYHKNYLNWRRNQGEQDNFIKLAGENVNKIIDSIVNE
jgi:hypothetical protein